MLCPLHHSILLTISCINTLPPLYHGTLHPLHHLILNVLNVHLYPSSHCVSLNYSCIPFVLLFHSLNGIHNADSIYITIILFHIHNDTILMNKLRVVQMYDVHSFFLERVQRLSVFFFFIPVRDGDVMVHSHP